MANYIGAIDQGTTSSRFIVFDRSGRIVTTAQKEHEQIYPKPGWVEHNPDEIWARTQEVITEALKAKNLTAKDLAGVGITNQRETTVVWNKKTVSRCTTPSSGRIRVLPTTLRSIPVWAARTSTVARPVYRWRRTSAA